MFNDLGIATNSPITPELRTRARDFVIERLAATNPSECALLLDMLGLEPLLIEEVPQDAREAVDAV